MLRKNTPAVNTFYFEYLFHEFALHELEIYKIICLDKAGYHRAKDLQLPQNIRLVYLPSSNPVERLWRNMKDKAAFRNFKDEQELEDWISTTTKNYSHQQIAALTRYPYIKEHSTYYW